MPFLYIPPHARLPHRTAHSSDNVCPTPATPFVISRGVRTPVTNTATTPNVNKNGSDADKRQASRPGPDSSNRHNYPRRRQKHPNPNRHTNAINQAARCGDIIRLESSLRAAKADKYILNVLNYTTIADGYIRAKEPGKAFEVFAEMRARQITPTSASIRVAAKAASAMTNHKLAIDAILGMIEWSIKCYTPGYNPECTDLVRAWNQCLSALLQHGAVNQALKLLMRMMHESCDNPAIPFPEACSFNQCITYLGRSNRFLEAMSLFGTMLVGHYCRHHRNHVSPAPDVITFNAILDAALTWDRQLPSCINCSQGSPSSEADTTKKWDQPPNPTVSFVDAVVSCMDRRNVEPDLLTETLILRVLSRNHNFERQRDKETNRLFAPEAEPLSTKATSDLQRFTRSQIQRAISKFPLLLDKPYFDAALAALGSTNDINMIIQVFDKMRSHAIRPDQYTIRALLRYTRVSHDSALAQFLIHTLYCLGYQPDYRTYTMAIASCADQPLMAHTLVEQAMEKGVALSPAMVNAAISTSGHDVSSAIRLWQQLRTKASSDAQVDQILADRVVYDALFRVCGRSGNPRDAVRIWYACKNAKHVQPQSAESRALFNAFMRGLDEGQKESEVNRNIFKKNYMKLLRVECGVPDNIDWPVQRIRIKW